MAAVAADVGVTVAREAAFEAFYLAAWPQAVRSLTFVVGSQEVAEDLVHDAVVEVFRRWDRIDHPDAYLRRASLNRGLTWLRRARREGLVEEVEDQPAEAWSVGDVERMLVNLPPRQRAAVVLKYLDGLTDLEIADALGCRPGTVGPLLTRARRQLHEELTHDG